MRTAAEIHEKIIKDFQEKVQDVVQTGSNIDLYTGSVSKVLEDVHTDIENNKNPHIWTKLSGTDLDATGVWVNCPREPNEADINYKYRLLNWMPKNESGNETAISDTLLDPTYASNIEFVAKTKGAGTATCYIIPKSYDSDTITKALEEAKEKTEAIASPGLYVEYVIPSVRAVRLMAYLRTNNGDDEMIKKNIEAKLLTYINKIPPKEYMKVGEMNKLGEAVDNVEYFSIVSVIINNEVVDEIDVLQEIDTKLLFDSITWIDE